MAFFWGFLFSVGFGLVLGCMCVVSRPWHELRLGKCLIDWMDGQRTKGWLDGWTDGGCWPPKWPQWASSPGLYAPVLPPPTLNKGWLWLTESCGRDNVWCTRLGCKRHCSFCVVPWAALLGGRQPPRWEDRWRGTEVSHQRPALSSQSVLIPDPQKPG